MRLEGHQQDVADQTHNKTDQGPLANGLGLGGSLFVVDQEQDQANDGEQETENIQSGGGERGIRRTAYLVAPQEHLDRKYTFSFPQTGQVQLLLLLCRASASCFLAEAREACHCTIASRAFVASSLESI